MYADWPARGERRGLTRVALLVVGILGLALLALIPPAVQRMRAQAARAECAGHLAQLARACLAYESNVGAFPRGNAPASPTFDSGDNGASWVFMVLPYLGQEKLYERVRAAGTITSAVNQGLFEVRLPQARCPSDDWDRGDIKTGGFFNYVGSSGPQCNNAPVGACDTPIFQKYCNGRDTNSSGPRVPPTLSPPTYPGYEASWSWGDSPDPAQLRGMFGRGGALVRSSSVTDGLANTILLSEILPEFTEFQRYNPFGWAFTNFVSQGQTIQPMNWPIDPVPLPGPARHNSGCADSIAADCPSGPTHCIWNWHVTWGFRSRHAAGCNFAFADGSVHFLRDDIEHQLYQYLGCRHDHNAVVPPE